jgi:hypothetical protein
MNSIKTWILTRIATRAAWNYHRDRELHQRLVLLAWHRIIHVALNNEVNDNSAVLREMSQDAHDIVWGRASDIQHITG